MLCAAGLAPLGLDFLDILVRESRQALCVLRVHPSYLQWGLYIDSALHGKPKRHGPAIPVRSSARVPHSRGAAQDTTLGLQ